MIDIKELFSILYNEKKLLWVSISISTVCITIMTSDEIRNYISNNIYKSTQSFYYLVYIIIFLSLNLCIRYVSIKEIKYNLIYLSILLIITIFLDVFLLTLMGCLTFLLVPSSGEKYINIFQGVLTISLPLSVGVEAVSYINMKYIKKEIKELKEDVLKHKEKLEGLNELNKKIKSGIIEIELLRKKENEENE